MAWRQSIDVEGLGHPNPIPMGCRVGNMLFTSAIGGNDRKTRERPTDPDVMVRNAFDNVRAVLEKGGATPADVMHFEVYLRDDTLRPALNKYWLEMFPDPNSRPARHVELGKDHNIGIMIQASCVISEG